VSNTLGFYI